jgi:hypothetical protein
MARFIQYQSGRAFVEPTKEFFDGLEQAIVWAETYVPHQLRTEMDKLCFYMALINQGYARKMSFGPYDPGGLQDELAWRSPEEGIRRISQRYYLGWRIRKIKPAVWQLYNASREAYFIEFGIHTSLRRIRRPVRKLSLRKTMSFMMTTDAYHRIWVDCYVNPKYEHTSYGFHQIVTGPGKGGLTGKLRGALVTFGTGYQPTGRIGGSGGVGG